MTQKKILMLGAFAVGKTSLTERFVTSSFSERYRTTVGVRIHKKVVRVAGRELTLIIWDLAGEDEFVAIRTPYLRGAAGYLLVADGTRADTLRKACELRERARGAIGEAPFVLLLNKHDRLEDWALQEGSVAGLIKNGWDVRAVSAKSGDGVEDAFLSLAARLV
ncbi:MAG: GTP-binding protein [Acidobacteria bacterium]|nr:GTP-binding protein [Acidobacteriota bacterium]